MEKVHAMRIGIACDHGGFPLKNQLVEAIRHRGDTVVDFGATAFDASDDYPDFVIPLAEAVAHGNLDRGVAVCGSGVGASIAANKVRGVRAALIFDAFSAKQGVEDDDLNVLCLGARVLGPGYATELLHLFLDARFTGAERHLRRLEKVQAQESKRNAESVELPDRGTFRRKIGSDWG